MIDDTTDLPFYPYLLEAERNVEPPADRSAEPTAPAEDAGTAASDPVRQPTPSFAVTVADAIPVSYVAWERDRVVLGWLWWDDASNASWHVPNVYEVGAREENGRDLLVVHPWVDALAEAAAAGRRPSSAIQELLADEPDEGSHLVPVQAPMRARSLRHLEQIAGLDEYREAEAAWRGAKDPAPTPTPEPVSADPAPDIAAPAAAPAPTAAPTPVRRRRRFPFFWRRG